MKHSRKVFLGFVLLSIVIFCTSINTTICSLGHCTQDTQEIERLFFDFYNYNNHNDSNDYYNYGLKSSKNHISFPNIILNNKSNNSKNNKDDLDDLEDLDTLAYVENDLYQDVDFGYKEFDWNVYDLELDTYSNKIDIITNSCNARYNLGNPSRQEDNLLTKIKTIAFCAGIMTTVTGYLIYKSFKKPL